MDFKIKVKKVIGHETGGTRMGVRFYVIWEGYDFSTLERSADIMNRGGIEELRSYVRDLSKRQEVKRRFTAMLKNQPDLANLLKSKEIGQTEETEELEESESTSGTSGIKKEAQD